MNVRLSAVAVLVGILACSGCGRPSVTVTGRVTCQDKPVSGTILFSPKGEGADNTGPAVSAPLNDDGSYELRLTTVGKHSVVVSPRDVKFRLKRGEVPYPCDLAPKDWEVKAGENNIVIELPRRSK